MFTFAYHPIPFYLITILTSLALGPIAAYLSARGQSEKILPLLILDLCVPCVTAIAMIYFSGNKEMIQDFWTRLLSFKVGPGFLAFIILLMPCVMLLATALSLLFGYSADQFFFAKNLSVMKGWSILGIFLPLLLAPLIEELGWRGYGVDSLRAHYNLFTTSVIFGILWALWHLPLFFIKGFYQNQLWDLGTVYVLNFFVSTFIVAFLMNWVYYHTDRSIPAIVLFHAIINLSSILLRTEPFTKCIATAVLALVLIVILFQDRAFFFGHKELVVQSELVLLQKQYEFPGATVAYTLPSGEVEAFAIGLADKENGKPMTIHSRMLAASIGKTFAAATMIALAKEGRLKLDDPLSKWLGKRSWYSRLPNEQTITLRHLLTHSSGLPDHVKTAGFAQLFAKELKSAEVLIELILDQPPLFESGKGWQYTDTGYILLGLVIESVTGSSYYDEIERRFIKPLNLHQTAPSNQRTLRSLAAGYTSEDNFFHLPLKTVDKDGIMVWNPAIEWTGGGLISTSSDLAAWAKLLYEGKAMPYDYMDDLLQAITVGDQESGISFGLGVAIEEKSPFGKRYGHLGVIPGYTSSMRYYPQYGVAIAFQINTDVGVSDHSTELVNDMENRLARVIFSTLQPKN